MRCVRFAVPRKAATLAMVFMCGALVAAASTNAVAFEPPLAESYLHSGKLAEGERALADALKQDPKSDSLRFQLGALRFIRAVERMGQSMHRYGLRSDRGQRMSLPFARLPVPVNNDPEKFTYADSRRILRNLIDDLAKAEAVLAEIRDESVKVRLRLGETRLDFEGDGKPNDPFITVINRYFAGGRDWIKPENLDIAFDRGDVAWLRGYCHFLSALSEMLLAHNGKELFDFAAPLLFAKAETPYSTMQGGGPGPLFFDAGDGVDIADFIAVFHLIRLPIQDPDRMKTALDHLKSMASLSRESWRFIQEETDNDREWLPNPNQNGALGVRIQRDRISAWLSFIDEMEHLLDGKRLIPFWRGRNPELGLNLRRVFTEPKGFDLVLWFQGVAAEPYLEKGPMTDRQVWMQLQRVFGGEFFGFAFWFN